MGIRSQSQWVVKVINLERWSIVVSLKAAMYIWLIAWRPMVKTVAGGKNMYV